MKVCNKCNQEKDENDFYIRKNRSGTITLRLECKSCFMRSRDPQKRKESDRRYYKNHAEEKRLEKREFRKKYPEKYKDQYTRNYQRNKEKILSRIRTWRQNNRDVDRERSRKWAINNPEKSAQRHRNRRARLRTTGIVTVSEWEELKKRYEYTCLCCGVTEPDIKLQQDHVIPISRGGLNLIDNIQPLCPDCNYKKHTKDTDYRKNWRIYAK